MIELLLLCNIFGLILLGIYMKFKIDGLAASIVEKLLKQNDDGKEQLKEVLDSINQGLFNFTSMNESKADSLRSTIDDKLYKMQHDNTEKLERIRQTVEEKLHETLENKLMGSFKIVAENLEQVHKGLGEMQNLATNVGDLKKIFNNVKTRGVWGEAHLEGLLQQMLAPQQYIKNAAVSNSAERVEFAIKIPTLEEGDNSILLPIDSKLPMNPFEQLQDALEGTDIEVINACRKKLELAVKGQARDISKKYINPPVTCEFAIMFIPVEAIYAELLRIPGFIDDLQREYRVIITCPTTFSALLSSLQIGFRAVSIEKRTSAVWKLLETVKKEFGRFSVMLSKTKQRIDQASKEIELAGNQSSKIENKLHNITIPSEYTEVEQMLQNDEAA